jgi:hypothetical protein
MKSNLKNIFLFLLVLFVVTPCYASHALDGLVIIIDGVLLIIFFPISILAIAFSKSGYKNASAIKTIIGIVLAMLQLVVIYFNSYIPWPNDIKYWYYLFLLLMLIAPICCTYYFLKPIFHKFSKNNKADE